jgi:hypothetical protein
MVIVGAKVVAVAPRTPMSPSRFIIVQFIPGAVEPSLAPQPPVPAGRVIGSRRCG